LNGSEIQKTDLEKYAGVCYTLNKVFSGGTLRDS
jgi:hypothetical protein